MRIRFAAALMAVIVGSSGYARAACEPAAGSARDMAASWTRQCGTSQCGTVVGPRDVVAASAERRCPDGAWRAMIDAFARVRDAGGFVLLGEVHDNPDHHAFRAKLLEALLQGSDRRPGVVMEHVRADQRAALAAFTIASKSAAGGPAMPEAFFEALDWPKSGWPDQRIFVPLVDVLIARRLPILPGEPPRGAVRDLAMKGMLALAGDDPIGPILAQALPDNLQSALLDDLEASHCGLMPRTAFGGMAVAQRYRDAFQARALIAARKAHGLAVLLAGNGHVRADRGVPYYLRRIAPQVPLLSVQLVEHDRDKRDADAYVQRGPDGVPTADFFLITPRTARPDPCEAMRARFKRRSETPPPGKAP